jgi:hypothetical protein
VSRGLTPLLAAFLATAAAAQTRVTHEQAAPVLRALASNLPASLRGRSPQDLSSLWPAWVDQHDRAVRARLDRGDEDSLVNFWLYGTTFTAHPPAVARASAAPAADLEDIARLRLEDLLARAAAPGDNERLAFARRVLEGRNAAPATADGRERARSVLRNARQRMIREFAETERVVAAARPRGDGALAGANATIFRDRGLSSDTSVLSDYGVHVALETVARQGTLAKGGVRRVAVVGPGLDFTNKADGYDFYPQQTIQPFAVIDALRRTGLAASDLELTTFDVSARVNLHLRNAPGRASSSSGYVVTLPLDAEEAWAGEVLSYWQQWGRTIGDEVAALPVPAGAGAVRARAVRIRPDVVSRLRPLDLNIVVDRLPPDGGFDLVVATNVLVYYDVFEQALAAANIAAMLRPGGVFLTNTAVLPTPPLSASAAYLRVTHAAARYDEIYWYRRD